MNEGDWIDVNTLGSPYDEQLNTGKWASARIVAFTDHRPRRFHMKPISDADGVGLKRRSLDRFPDISRAASHRSIP